jgi:hypothetical protein
MFSLTSFTIRYISTILTFNDSESAARGMQMSIRIAWNTIVAVESLGFIMDLVSSRKM